MKVTLTTPLGGHATGDTITVTPKTAELLVNNGNATDPRDAHTPPKRPTNKKNTRSKAKATPEGGGDSPEESKSRRR